MKAIRFKDGNLTERLLRASILPEDYDACAQLSTEDRNVTLTYWSYKVGRNFLILCLLYLIFLY